MNATLIFFPTLNFLGFTGWFRFFLPGIFDDFLNGAVEEIKKTVPFSFISSSNFWLENCVNVKQQQQSENFNIYLDIDDVDDAGGFLTDTPPQFSQPSNRRLLFAVKSVAVEYQQQVGN